MPKMQAVYYMCIIMNANNKSQKSVLMSNNCVLTSACVMVMLYTVINNE